MAELRKVNPQAFGLDLSSHLLGLAPEHLRGWLLRGDMRRLPLRAASLAGICLWFTPFGYFSDQENQSLLAALQGLLAPGGLLLLDLMNASRLQADLVSEDVVERGGLRVHSRRSLEGGRVVKRMTLEHLDTGALREAVESVRVYHPDELRALTRPCGLVLTRTLGDYDGSPFLATVSPRWIGIFEKRDLQEPE